MRMEKEKLRLPDFIGIGPPRTGTTWLHQVLANGHVGVPRRIKELHFFDKHYSRGFEWYAGHFSQYSEQTRIGEITPDYFRSQEARARMARDIPGVQDYLHPERAGRATLFLLQTDVPSGENPRAQL